jgi:hypothetical protein
MVVKHGKLIRQLFAICFRPLFLIFNSFGYFLSVILASLHVSLHLIFSILFFGRFLPYSFIFFFLFFFLFAYLLICICLYGRPCFRLTDFFFLYLFICLCSSSLFSFLPSFLRFSQNTFYFFQNIRLPRYQVILKLIILLHCGYYMW